MGRQTFADARTSGAQGEFNLLAILTSAKNPDGTDFSLPVDIGSASVVITPGDIEIGAVELKDSTTGDRAAVTADGALKVKTPGYSADGTPTHATDVVIDGTAGGTTIAAANANRKSILIQNTGSNPMRVSYDGTAPTATHGVQITGGGSLALDGDYCPRLIVKAIREGGSNTTCGVTETV